MQAYRIDPESNVPLVHQVVRRIRVQIARGVVEVGTFLPSVRDLGAQLDINFNTVAKAYRLLEKEGLIEIRHGLGARVCGTHVSNEQKPEKNILLDELQDVIAQLTLSGANQEEVVDLFAEAIGRHYGEGEAGEA